ncbi:hypothetical protein [Erythrobacter sp. R86502]|uniref:hypothetical protein n=1 Tax=Erythrobacter sp. R86502 TaxID=3093846 RepID=UPI0036D3CAB6
MAADYEARRALSSIAARTIRDFAMPRTRWSHISSATTENRAIFVAYLATKSRVFAFEFDFIEHHFAIEAVLCRAPLS